METGSTFPNFNDIIGTYVGSFDSSWDAILSTRHTFLFQNHIYLLTFVSSSFIKLLMYSSTVSSVIEVLPKAAKNKILMKMINIRLLLYSSPIHLHLYLFLFVDVKSLYCSFILSIFPQIIY